MPYLPSLAAAPRTTLTTSAFGGYSRSPVLRDGEMSDMTNLSSCAYPLLSPRAPRRILRTLHRPGGMIAKDALAVIEGERLIYDGYPVPGVTLSTEADMLPKQLVSMGAYLCIWPDKVYVNTADLSDCGTMYAAWQAEGETMLSLCREDGTDYDADNIVLSPAPPASPEGGALWLDTGSVPHALRQYSAYTGEWVQAATTCVKIQSHGIGAQFAAWDGVTISGMSFPESEDPAIHRQLEQLNGDAVIHACGENYIVIPGLIDQHVTIAGGVRVERKVPDCDFITEANNRLWGCKYGMAEGEMVNEIYACKLGDFRNWRCYMGLSTDSYAVTVGSDGVFTGAATLKGAPLFFKEGCIHRINGYTPASFTLNTTLCRGVEEGSAQSLRVVGENLLYKSPAAVMLYDGSLPVPVSAALGDTRYHSASAGAQGERYYISMREAGGGWHLFVYDTRRGLWHREDDLHAVHFACLGGALCFINADTAQLMALGGGEGDGEGAVEWSAEFGPWGYEYEGRKYLSRFNLRLTLEEGSEAEAEIQYDSDGQWHSMGKAAGDGVQSVLFPVIPRRCDHCRLRLKGKGPMKLLSISRILETGSDNP